MLAYEEMLDNQCPGCLGQLDETTDSDIDWHVHAPTRCFKCTATIQAQEPYLTTNPDTGKSVTPHPQALLWEAIRS